MSDGDQFKQIHESQRASLVTRKRRDDTRFESRTNKLFWISYIVFLPLLLGCAALFVYALLYKKQALLIPSLVVTGAGMALGYGFKVARLLRVFKDWMD